MKEVPSITSEPRDTKVSRGWTVAVALGVLAVVGNFATTFILASAGKYSASNIGAGHAEIFWYGLLGYLIRKRQRQSGGYGWVVGGAIGLVVFLGGSMFSAFQNVRMEQESIIAAAQANIAAMNEQLPAMVDDSVRADRVSLDEAGMHFFLTMVDAVAGEMDIDAARVNYMDLYNSLVCESEGAKESLEAGAIMNYHFVDKNDNLVLEFQINRSSCP
jgi:hypothetical protein